MKEKESEGERKERKVREGEREKKIERVKERARERWSKGFTLPDVINKILTPPHKAK